MSSTTGIETNLLSALQPKLPSGNKIIAISFLTKENNTKNI